MVLLPGQRSWGRPSNAHTTCALDESSSPTTPGPSWINGSASTQQRDPCLYREPSSPSSWHSPPAASKAAQPALPSSPLHLRKQFQSWPNPKWAWSILTQRWHLSPSFTWSYFANPPCSQLDFHISMNICSLTASGARFKIAKECFTTYFFRYI